MSYRAIYAYAWNLVDEGVSEVIGTVAALGINTITVAGSYHAGKFLHPHGRSGKVVFPEDGTVYFNADPARYGTIKPILNSLVRERDVLREIAGTSQIGANVWLVLLHNSRRAPNGSAPTSSTPGGGWMAQEHSEASFGRRSRISRAAAKWSPPHERCATPAFPESRSTTTACCAGAISAGLPTPSPRSESDGVFGE